MPPDIENAEVERLIAEVARLAGESRTEAVRRALEERRDRLAREVPTRDRAVRLRRFLEHELWPSVPSSAFGRPMSKADEEAILGYDDGT